MAATRQHPIGLFMLGLGLLVSGCLTPSPESISEPSAVAARLLEAHGLLGKTIEARSASEMKQEVSPAELSALFDDLDAHEPFLGNLYVGFITGALARHQQRLKVEKRGRRAVIDAGGLAIRLRFRDRAWRIHLESSVPPEIKRRARAERDRLLKNNRISAR